MVILLISLRRVSPTATGRSPPDDFGRACKFAPTNPFLASGQTKPALIKLLTWAKSSRISFLLMGIRASLRCAGLRPVYPGAESFGKAHIAVSTSALSQSLTLTLGLRLRPRHLALSSILAGGCFFFISVITLSVISTGGCSSKVWHAFP